MKKISAIIVDDERLARVNLKRLLTPFENIVIVAEANSCATAIKAIGQYRPHLVFLDIQLSGETGFDLLEQINNDINVIFITAYDNYAIRAFEVNAVDYLLKPVNPERLKESIERITSSSNLSEQKGKYKYNDSVYIKLSSNASKFVKINTIRCITPVGNYSKLCLTNSKNAVVLKTLKQWEEELPDENFIRIHRSCLINIEFVQRVEKYDGRYYRLFLKESKVPLEISRRCMTKLKSDFGIKVT